MQSCSDYSIRAVRERGLAHGLATTAVRLYRCRPGHVADD